jgi:O-antigen ligase
LFRLQYGGGTKALLFGAVAVGVGATIAFGLGPLALAGCALIAIVSLPNGDRAARIFVLVVLAGYIAAERLFAYLSIPVGGLPLYVGEVAVAVGVMGLLAGERLPRLAVARRWIAGFLTWSIVVLLMRWGNGTILETFRDFSFVYYTAFALFSFAIPWERMEPRAFSAIAIVFVVQLLFAGAVILGLVAPDALGGAGELLTRADIKGANLIGGAAFFLLADHRLRISWFVRALLATTEIVLALMTGSRAVVVALVVFIGLMLFLRAGRAIRFVSLLLIVAAVFGATVQSGLHRETELGDVSPSRATNRLLVLVGLGAEDVAAPTLEEATGTAQWRRLLWSDIWRRQVSRPDWLLFGRGFGFDPVTEAGLVSHAKQSPRAPHSIIVDVLARLGVVGLFLFVGALAAIALAARRITFARSSSSALVRWLLVYWAALLSVALFGVILESPFGAAPFFTATGALLRLTSLEPAATDRVDNRESTVRPLGPPAS